MEPYKIEEVWNENKEMFLNVAMYLFGFLCGWNCKRFCCC